MIPSEIKKLFEAVQRVEKRLDEQNAMLTAAHADQLKHQVELGNIRFLLEHSASFGVTAPAEEQPINGRVGPDVVVRQPTYHDHCSAEDDDTADFVLEPSSVDHGD